MNKQQGSSLIVALILLTIITMVAVYSIEGSTIQSKMVASSLFSSLTYQECRNEQEANIRFYNENGGSQRVDLLSLVQTGGSLIADSATETKPITSQYDINPPRSSISTTWSYVRPAPDARSGYEVELGSISQAYLYTNNCIATFRFSTNNQTLGAIVDGLDGSGDVH